jgi:hypothetical protein
MGAMLGDDEGWSVHGQRWQSAMRRSRCIQQMASVALEALHDIVNLRMRHCSGMMMCGPRGGSMWLEARQCRLAHRGAAR